MNWCSLSNCFLYGIGGYVGCNATGMVLLVAFVMGIAGLACAEAGEHGFEGLKKYEYVQ